MVVATSQAITQVPQVRQQTADPQSSPSPPVPKPSGSVQTPPPPKGIGVIVSTVGLTIAALVAAFALAEGMLRVVEVNPEGYRVYPPGYHLRIETDSGILSGVRLGPKNFTISKDGLRARPLDAAASEYRILAIGASTTEQMALDDAD